MRRVHRGLKVGPRAEILEGRRLLAVSAAYLGLTDLDFAGPTASVGPGGVRNLELRISLPADSNGRPASLGSVDIEGPSGARWSYGDLTRADASIVVDAEPASAGDATRAYDLYLSPTVQVVDAVTGKVSQVTLPHDSMGSNVVTVDPNTGAITYPSPANQSTLRLSVAYTTGDGTTTSETWATNPALSVVVDLSGQVLADVPPAAPALDFGAFATTYVGQMPDGRARISIAGLPLGTTIDTSSLLLGDTAGQYWTYGSTGGRWELGASIAYSADHTSATVDFPPLRDESGTTMTLAFQASGSPTRHLLDVPVPVGSNMDLNRRDGGPIVASSPALTVYPTSPTTPDMVSYIDAGNQTKVVDLQTLLDGSSPYHNITLASGPAGSVFTLDKRLDIRTGMILKAATPDVTLNFTFATVVQGAINLYSSHVTLDGFKIRFANPSVAFTFNGWADPGSVAIISNRQDNGQVPHVDLNLLDLDIRAPYVPFGQNWGDNGAINTIATFDSGPYGSGVISGNTIHGGTVAIQGGPWTIGDNEVLGAVAGTVSDTAFSAFGAHDVLITGNLVSNAGADLVAASGTTKTGAIDRFLAANNGSYGLVVTGNTIRDNVGLIPPNPGGFSQGDPRNNPEIMVFEGYGKTFEGNVAATRVSSSPVASLDRRVITIGSGQLARFTPGAGPLVLVILDGPGAGTSIPLVQYDTEATATHFVLATPLPTGLFDFALVPAHNRLDVSGNTIDTRGTVSTGLVLSDTILDATVTGNTFLGDQSIERDGNGNFLTSQAIRFEVFVKYDGQAGNSYLPIDATIDHNTIEDAIGGVTMYLERGFPATFGRTYGFVRFHDNAFRYSYQDASIVTTQFVDSYATVVGPSVVPSAEAARFLDPGTIRITSANNTVLWKNVSAPTSYTTLASVTINGVAYGKPVPTPVDPLVTTIVVVPPAPATPAPTVTPSTPAPTSPPSQTPATPPATPPPAVTPTQPAATPPGSVGMSPPGVLLIPPSGSIGVGTSAGPASTGGSPPIGPPAAILVQPGLTPVDAILPEDGGASPGIPAEPDAATSTGDEPAASSIILPASATAMATPVSAGSGAPAGRWRAFWGSFKQRGRFRFLIPSVVLAPRARAKGRQHPTQAGGKAGTSAD